MTAEELRQLIAQGESERLELKASVPPPDLIARHLASFANGEGGHLVFGVREPANIVGASEERVQAAVASAQRRLSGTADISMEVVQLDGRSVPVVSVRRAIGLVSASGGYYRRVGDTLRALTADEIRAHLAPAQPSEAILTELAQAVAQQTQTIDRLRADFERANSTTKKLVIGGVGTAIGAILKHLIELWPF